MRSPPFISVFWHSILHDARTNTQHQRSPLRGLNTSSSHGEKLLCCQLLLHSGKLATPRRRASATFLWQFLDSEKINIVNNIWLLIYLFHTGYKMKGKLPPPLAFFSLIFLLFKLVKLCVYMSDSVA